MHRRKSILIVEDQPVIAMALKALALDAGLAPTIAPKDAGLTLELLSRCRPDAAIIDIETGIDGDPALQIADVLRRRGKPLIFTSTSPRVGLDERFAEVPVVAKPYASDEIAVLLDAMLVPHPA